MATTTASSKGQIVIPAALRKKFGIKQGTKIRISAEEGRIVLEPITREYVRKLRGSLKGHDLVKDLVEERSSERAREDG